MRNILTMRWSPTGAGSCREWSRSPVFRQKKLVKHGWFILCHPQRMIRVTYPCPSTRHTQKHAMILPAAPKWQHPQHHCGPSNSRIPIVLKGRNRAKRARLSENVRKRTFGRNCAQTAQLSRHPHGPSRGRVPVVPKETVPRRHG